VALCCSSAIVLLLPFDRCCVPLASLHTACLFPVWPPLGRNRVLQPLPPESPQLPPTMEHAERHHDFAVLQNRGGLSAETTKTQDRAYEEHRRTCCFLGVFINPSKTIRVPWGGCSTPPWHMWRVESRRRDDKRVRRSHKTLYSRRHARGVDKMLVELRT
jgi:hypothetical protein